MPSPAHCVSLGKYKRRKTQGGRGEELVVVNRRATTYERNGKEEKVSRGRWKETKGIVRETAKRKHSDVHKM